MIPGISLRFSDIALPAIKSLEEGENEAGENEAAETREREQKYYHFEVDADWGSGAGSEAEHSSLAPGDTDWDRGDIIVLEPLPPPEQGPLGVFLDRVVLCAQDMEDIYKAVVLDQVRHARTATASPSAGGDWSTWTGITCSAAMSWTMS